jgi:S1/P1 Nuclease
MSRSSRWRAWGAAVVVCALCLLLPAPARAWNETGHMIVAYIAYKHLTPAAKQTVDRLLAVNPDIEAYKATLPPNWDDEARKLAAFMYAATWPDVIKSRPDYITDGDHGGNRPPSGPAASQNIGYADKFKHQYWHFIDMPISTDGSKTDAPPAPNAVTQLAIFMPALKNPASSDDLRSYDLVWIAHLVGDLHQPLHTVARFSKAHPAGDDGGNAASICHAPCRVNLHGFWDNILGAAGLQEALAVGEMLDVLPAPAGGDVTDVKQWISEGVEVAKQAVYIAPIGAESPDATVSIPTPAYRAHARQVAEQRAILAGRRLARILNDSFK